jgi:predicted butyrate kinase (DUF1464 family)
MADISQFKVFKSEPYFRIGRIYCVITGTKHENSSGVDAEWHYYLKDKDEKISCAKIFYEGADTIEHVWNYYLIDNLKDTIDHEELLPIFEKTNDFSLYKSVELEELEKESLIYLSAENMEFINHLQKQTKCRELKKLVDHLPIIKIQKF